MTLDELRKQWGEAYAIIKRERAWRQKVFAKNPRLLKEKLEEVNTLQETLRKWKDELKPHCEPGLEQSPLLDVPKKAGYQ